MVRNGRAGRRATTLYASHSRCPTTLPAAAGRHGHWAICGVWCTTGIRSKLRAHQAIRCDGHHSFSWHASLIFWMIAGLVLLWFLMLCLIATAVTFTAARTVGWVPRFCSRIVHGDRVAIAGPPLGLICSGQSSLLFCCQVADCATQQPADRRDRSHPTYDVDLGDTMDFAPGFSVGASRIRATACAVDPRTRIQGLFDIALANRDGDGLQIGGVGS